MRYEIIKNPVATIVDGQPTTKGAQETAKRNTITDAIALFLEWVAECNVFIPPFDTNRLEEHIEAGEPFTAGGVGYDWAISIEKCKPQPNS